MAIVDLPLVQIKEFETQTLFPLREVGPGTYHTQLQIEGNSILSSLLVTHVSPDASIQVNYFQTTTGDEDEERTPLVNHTPKTTGSMAADTIIVARVHLKPVCEVIITGGTVTFGLMVTMVSAFASDIESSLFKDGYFVNGTERGIPLMTFDDASGQMKFMKSKGGNLIVSEEKQGDPIHLTHSDTLLPNERRLILANQQFEKSFRMSQFTVVSASDYRVSVQINGSLALSSRTTKYQPQSDQLLDPYKVAPKNSLVTIEAERLSSDDDGSLDVYLRGYEFINEEEEAMSSLTKVVFNATGALILPFKAVAWEDNNSVSLADADGLNLDDFAGVTQDGIAHLGYGIIHKIGEVPNALLGKGAVAGQPVYLSTTPGELSLTPPASGTVFRIGRAEPPSGAHTGEATSLFIDPQIIAEA
jgi:hypothetical protein